MEPASGAFHTRIHICCCVCSPLSGSLLACCTRRLLACALVHSRCTLVAFIPIAIPLLSHCTPIALPCLNRLLLKQHVNLLFNMRLIVKHALVAQNLCHLPSKRASKQTHKRVQWECTCALLLVHLRTCALAHFCTCALVHSLLACLLACALVHSSLVHLCTRYK